MNLILIEPDELRKDGTARLTGTRATHARGVLRVARGDIIRVGIVDGRHGRARVAAVDDEGVDLECTFDAPPGDAPRVDLLLALPRPKVLRRLWAQLAALGVRRVILTNAARVERSYFDTHVVNPATYRPLLLEGLQQARDTRLPEVTVHRQFRRLVEDQLDTLVPDALRLVAHPGAAATVSGTLRARTPPRVLMALGPEGGWNEFELTLLDQHRFQQVGMGTRTLRSDTACIALLALVHDSLNGG